MYLMIGDSFFEGVFEQYENEWFWQSFVAEVLIVLPVAVVIYLIYSGILKCRIKEQLVDMKDDMQEQLYDLKVGRVAGIEKQLADAQKQLDHMDSHETAAKRTEQGNARKQLLLGWCYYYGDGAEKNLEQAAECFRKAAELGLTQAQLQLGECYANGWGVPKDRDQANYWYAKAAEQKNEDARK